MKTLPIPLFCALIAACGGEAQETAQPPTDTQPGQCGAVEEYNVLIRAKAHDATGQPLAGVEIRVVEDSWHQPEEVWGSAITDATGVGEFTANGIVSVENCWGTALNYHLVGQLGDRFGGDDSYNSTLFNALNSGEPYVADSTAFPFTVQ